MPSDAFVDAIVDDRFERTSAVAPLVDMTERFGLMLGVTTAPSHKMTHLRSYYMYPARGTTDGKLQLSHLLDAKYNGY